VIKNYPTETNYYSAEWRQLFRWLWIFATVVVILC